MTLRTRAFAAAPLLLLLMAACSPASVAPSAGPETSSSASSSPLGSASAEPTPFATTAGDAQAQVLQLGRRIGPFDIVEAFGSLWVTAHHTNQVIRIDPTSLEVVARIATGPGPGWFAVTDDAIWVTNKNGSGMSRIDPETNELVTSVGSGSPCGAPMVAAGSVWYLGCDTQLLVRIDPVANKVIAQINSLPYSEPFHAGDQLISATVDGLARLDPATNTFAAMGGCCGLPFGYDGTTVWLNGDNELTRVDPTSGDVVATVHLGSGATSITFADGSAWITFMSRHQVIQVDLATSDQTGEIDLGLAPITVYAAFEALWVTDYDAGNLWKVTP
jgi:streptogramin lyase